MSRYEEKEERQELKLGDDRGTPSKYSRRLKLLSLGMLGRHPLIEHYMPSLMALKKALPVRQPRSFRESFISVECFHIV